MDISLVIPVYNEAESLPRLMAWIARVMGEMSGLQGGAGWAYEAIFVDDGSTDSSWEVIQGLRAEYGEVVVGVRFRRNYGKSAALYSGFEAATGEVVITMDADLQDSPDEIPELYRMVREQGYDLVSGWKQKRYDPGVKTIPSKLFNATARRVSGIRLHDFNCGLKAYRKKVVKSIEVYGEMHRYIPILAKQAGFGRIGEKVVQHRAREFGVSKYGWERMLKGYIDLLSVMFITRFGRRPMYLFGGLGTLMFMVGTGIAGWLIAEKLYLQNQGLPVRGVADQPLFYIAIATVVMGVQLFLAGFLGEMINRSAPERNRYLIDETI